MKKSVRNTDEKEVVASSEPEHLEAGHAEIYRGGSSHLFPKGTGKKHHHETSKVHKPDKENKRQSSRPPKKTLKLKKVRHAGRLAKTE